MNKTSTPKAPRPPNDRGQGRKALPEELRTTTKSCRLTPEGWAKFALLGGSKWLQEAVDRDYKAKTKPSAE